jgi:hypothetical protein
MHRGKADAEDIVQEVFFVLYKKQNISVDEKQTVNKQESVEFLQRSVLPLIFLSGNGQHFVNYFK